MTRTYRLEADSKTIYANPIETKKPGGGSSFTLGFPVCKVEELISTPESVVELLNLGQAMADTGIPDPVDAVERARSSIKAALNMVDGDGFPPDWDYLREALAALGDGK